MKTSLLRQQTTSTSGKDFEPPLLFFRVLLLLFLCLLSILIHEKTKVLREENENLSHIRKRETILSKKENIELRASDKAKEESIPNTATKKLNRTHELERGTNKLRTLATESSTGPSNKAFKNIPGDKTQESQQEQRNHFEQLRRYDGSAFSCYLRHDRKMEKGDRIGLAPFSKHSFGQKGDVDLETGNFSSETSGLFMVSVTVHIKADVLIIPGHKKKQKMKSKKVAKTQLKLIILVDNKFKEKRSLSATAVLPGQGVVQTVTATGLLQVEAGQSLSVLVQATGSVHILAGSHFSGVSVGP